MDYYVYPNLTTANAALTAINNSGWFPLSGERNGKKDNESQKAERWIEAPLEMLSGEYAIPRIPTHIMDYIGVPSEQRELFAGSFAQDIRTLSSAEFVREEEEE